MRDAIVARIVVLACLVGTAAPASAQSWRTLTETRQSSGEEALSVDVEYGAGVLMVSPAAPGLLYRVRVRYDEERARPVLEFESDRLEVGLDQEHRFRLRGVGNSESELDVGLPRDVELDLRMEFGAVRADIELGGLSLTDLAISSGASDSRISFSEPNPRVLDQARLEVGAARFEASGLGNLNAERIDVDVGLGEAVLRFTGDWRRDSVVSVEMGLGALRLAFPRGLGVRIRRDTFLSSFQHDDFVSRDGEFYSVGWEEADRRVTVEVSAAFGSVDVEWVP